MARTTIFPGTLTWLAILITLGACRATAEPTPTSLPATSTPVTPAITPTNTIAAPAVSPSPPPPVSPSSPAGPETAPAPSGNPFHTLLGPATLPEEWAVEPCPGDAPFLCVARNGQNVGYVELLSLPLADQTDFQAILEAHGLTPGARPEAGDTYAASARAALADLAANYLASVEADRQQTYPPGARFIPSPMEPVRVGVLPGLSFGFTSVGADEAILERYVNYAAFDEDTLYWLGAQYDPQNVTTFTTDDDLLAFVPYLQGIVAALRLPP
ncbi:MAG: hypothetical protein L0332_05565 [Chloroflexi bacterium]|nr:hypothetical protein [Chloroflexota bacterium]MCI0576874.1 hypothetical protein [Chloroflexota bacterium]MCI0646472.1 hypothetical protein [Chloroflexota bacterium]MCI0726176.1 hypothetical protein [Chloroflexota bacterium]